MRTTLLVAALVLALVAPVQAQAVRTIAVADFENFSVDSGVIPPAALSGILGQLLQRQGAQVRAVSGGAVRDAMRARGYTAEDLLYPSRAAEVAQAVGADWVVTGRWTQLRIISRSVPADPSSPGIREGDAFAIADVTVRVLDASTRRILFQGRFDGRSPGGDLSSLYLAATEALRGAATTIVDL